MPAVDSIELETVDWLIAGAARRAASSSEISSYPPYGSVIGLGACGELCGCGLCRNSGSAACIGGATGTAGDCGAVDCRGTAAGVFAEDIGSGISGLPDVGMAGFPGIGGCVSILSLLAGAKACFPVGSVS
ncbi:MAG: hypothetical protein MR015_02340 [Clostridiales bacterium]|nr:hypothetical protein [Clostridiales bacterium]